MKKALASTIAAASYLSFALPAFAIEVCPKGGFANLCSVDSSKFGTLVQTAVTVLLIIAVVIALFFLILGGIRWITSGGDKAKVESARNTIIAAIVGLVVAFLAYFILTVVLSIFGLSLGTIKLPTI